MPRRNTKLSERLTPCQCCGYPISQRHHLLEFANFGESHYTRQLCANCHELFHIIDKAFDDIDGNPKSRAVTLLDVVGRAWGKNDSRITYLCNLVNLTRQGRKEEVSRNLPSLVLRKFFGE